MKIRLTTLVSHEGRDVEKFATRLEAVAEMLNRRYSVEEVGAAEEVFLPYHPEAARHHHRRLAELSCHRLNQRADR